MASMVGNPTGATSAERLTAPVGGGATRAAAESPRQQAIAKAIKAPRPAVKLRP